MKRTGAVDREAAVEILVTASHRLIRETARLHRVWAGVRTGVRYDEMVLDDTLFAYMSAKLGKDQARRGWEEWVVRDPWDLAPLPAADATDVQSPPPETTEQLRFMRWLYQHGRLSDQT